LKVIYSGLLAVEPSHLLQVVGVVFQEIHNISSCCDPQARGKVHRLWSQIDLARGIAPSGEFAKAASVCEIGVGTELLSLKNYSVSQTR